MVKVIIIICSAKQNCLINYTGNINNNIKMTENNLVEIYVWITTGCRDKDKLDFEQALNNLFLAYNLWAKHNNN